MPVIRVTNTATNKIKLLTNNKIARLKYRASTYPLMAINWAVVLIFAINVTLVASRFLLIALSSLRALTQNSLAKIVAVIIPR